MRSLFRTTVLSSCAAALAACATAPAPVPVVPVMAEPAPAAPVVPVRSAHDRLFDLFKASDQSSLERNPQSAIARGDLRYADRFGDYITDEYYAAERAAAEQDLATLHTIPRGELNATDQIAYDTFEYETKDSLRGLQPDLLALKAVRPLNHFFGFHTYYATFASGKGTAPFKTLDDYDNNLKRHKGFVTYLDRAIARFKQGEQSGVVETKMTVRNMIEQLNAQLKLKPEQSPYYGPIKQFPAGIGAADRARLTREYRAAITDEIYPTLTRLRDFLKTEYLGQAREGVGLMYMKGGDKLYRQLVESTTTLPMSPDEVHNLGLSEVARITGEMDKIRQETGFKGNLGKFFDYIRTSRKFQAKSRDELTQGYYAMQKKVEPKLHALFSTMPKAPLEIRPYDPFREKFEAGGSYEEGSADGSRPGVFYFNAYDLPARNTT